MSRHRDRASAQGLLPRMEARPWADGMTVTYRYHPVGGKPLNLGADRAAAIMRVAEMIGAPLDPSGTVNALWEDFKRSPRWARLAEGTRRVYTENSIPLLRVFGETQVADIKPRHVARYLRDEREGKTVANREIALLSSMLRLAIERGDIETNPCRDVERNHEEPRHEVPETKTLEAFVAWALSLGGQQAVIVSAAEFIALTGNRRVEFIRLQWPDWTKAGVTMTRAKQRKRRRAVQTVEVIAMSPALRKLRARLQKLAHDPVNGYVFPTRSGNPYTSRGFMAMWQKLTAAAREAKVLAGPLRFHDLRAYYVTEFKRRSGALPDLHSNPATTATVYDRTVVVERKAL